MQAIPDFFYSPPALWKTHEFEQWRMPEENVHEGYRLKYSKYNPTPGETSLRQAAV